MIRPNPFLPSGSSFSICIPLFIFSHATVRLRPYSSCLARTGNASAGNVSSQCVVTMRRRGGGDYPGSGICRCNASSASLPKVIPKLRVPCKNECSFDFDRLFYFICPPFVSRSLPGMMPLTASPGATDAWAQKSLSPGHTKTPN